MNQQRWHHGASLLPDGRVLVSGGLDAKNNTLSSVEIYDPATNTWTDGPSIPKRGAHIQHTLNDGRVLVAAGYTDYLTYSTTGAVSTYLFDPNTNLWTEVGSLHTAKPLSGSAVCGDGRVLILGESGAEVGNTEIFNPLTESWTETDPLNQKRSGTTLVTMADGKVMAAGGWAASSQQATVEIYDPSTETWTTVEPLNVARASASGSLLTDGRILISGGTTTSSNALTESEIYDPATDTWTLQQPLVSGRMMGTQVTLSSGEVILAGGWINGGNVHLFQSFDPATGQWQASTQIGESSFEHPVILLPDDRLLSLPGKSQQFVSLHLINPSVRILEKANARITVQEGETTIASNGVYSLGDSVLGSTSVKTLTLTNAGTEDVVIGSSEIADVSGGQFVAGAAASTTLAVGASTTMTVSFKSSDLGEENATLYLSTKRGTDNVILFPIQLTATGISGLPLFEAWADDAGLLDEDAAPEANPHGDGVANLLKYAFNLDAQTAGGSIMEQAGTTGLPRVSRVPGATPKLRLEFIRRKNSGLIYTPQHGTTLDDFVPMTASPTVTSIDEQWERVVIEQPATGPAGFARVKVSLP
jgi:N-acetylneuraminic acid mutarotase